MGGQYLGGSLGFASAPKNLTNIIFVTFIEKPCAFTKFYVE
jgi:hypothetical protein